MGQRALRGDTHNTHVLRNAARRVAFVVSVDPRAAEIDAGVAVGPGAGTTTDTVAGLEDEHAAACTGEVAGGDGAGPASSNDDGVEDLGHREWMKCRVKEAASLRSVFPTRCERPAASIAQSRLAAATTASCLSCRSRAVDRTSRAACACTVGTMARGAHET